MRIYKTGERCPCCGQPIQLTEPEALYVYSHLINDLGLGEEDENAVPNLGTGEGEQHADQDQ